MEADRKLRERVAAAAEAALAENKAVSPVGRVGRTAAGRALDEEAVTAAVIASVRHEDTDYDAMLMSGRDRQSARALVWGEVERVLENWRSGLPQPRQPRSSSGAGDTVTE
ncbi:MAG: DUF2293 domain-containing protein [Candidatus Dormibacteraeota bacterium]|nr:DUF2293 domain-containing protein [Candidatus Dormibacteraeota bacterium]